MHSVLIITILIYSHDTIEENKTAFKRFMTHRTKLLSWQRLENSDAAAQLPASVITFSIQALYHITKEWKVSCNRKRCSDVESWSFALGAREQKLRSNSNLQFEFYSFLERSVSVLIVLSVFISALEIVFYLYWDKDNI